MLPRAASLFYLWVWTVDSLQLVVPSEAINNFILLSLIILFSTKKILHYTQSLASVFLGLAIIRMKQEVRLFLTLE